MLSLYVLYSPSATATAGISLANYGRYPQILQVELEFLRLLLRL